MRILIAEADPVAALLLQRRLERLDHTVVAVADCTEAAFMAAAELHPDIALVAERLPGTSAVAHSITACLGIPVVSVAREGPPSGERNPGTLYIPWDDRSIAVALDVAHFRQALQRRLSASEQSFLTILKSIGDGVIVTDTAGTTTFINPVAASLIGVDAHEAIGSPISALLHIVDAETGTAVDALAEQPPGDEPAEGGLLLVTHGGHLPVETSVAPIRGENGATTGAVVILREISARRAAEAEMRRTHARLAATVERLERQTLEISLLTTLGNDLQRCTSLPEAYGAIATIAHRLFPEDDGALFVQRQETHSFERVARWGEEIAGVEGEVLVVPLAAQGEVLGMLHLRLTQQPFADGGELGNTVRAARQRLVTAIADQAALGLANVRLRQTLRDQAIRDPLTGLFNRRYMEETLERELHRAARDKHAIGLVMIDIDHFKDVNDTYGHEVGDVVLRAVGEVLMGAVRTEDIVCRYGGEEFLLVLPNACMDTAITRASQICEAVRKLHITHGPHELGQITISAGVSAITNPDTGVAESLRAADNALYRAKHAGRDRVEAA